MSRFQLYLIRIKVMIENKMMEDVIMYVTVTVRSTTIITDYVGMIGIISPKVDL